MSYYPRPPHPYMGYYEGYENYGYYTYGGAGYGPPRPYGGGYGRGRGRGGSYSTNTIRTVSTTGSTQAAGASSNAAQTASAAVNTVVKMDLGTAMKKGPGTVSSNAAQTASAAVNTVVKMELGTAMKKEPGTAATKPVTVATTSSASTSTATATKPSSATTAAKTSTTTTATTASTSAATTATKPKADAPLTEENPLPAEISDKFYPNRCELCSVSFPIPRDIFIPEKGGVQYMKSNLQSSMHFSGKSHKKKLRNVFHKYCSVNRISLQSVPKKTRELMRDMPVLPKDEKSKEELEKVDLHCKVCDLSFTSIQHANQHYGGRNHQRKLEGKPPLKTGYFNPHTGRWQRHSSQPEVFVVDAQTSRAGRPLDESPRSGYYGRFYNSAARNPNTSVNMALADPNVVTVEVVPGNLASAGVKTGTGTGAPSKYHCSICNVSAVNQAGLDTHLNGSKHKLQAMKMGVRSIGKTTPKLAGATDANGSAANGGEGPPPAKRPARDFSIYKTPTGKYYCLPCNMTMNSEMQFSQHFESKKHKVETAKHRSAAAAAAQ